MSERYRVTVVTLFGAFFDSPLEISLLGKAVNRGDVEFATVDPRDYTHDRHRTVDDSPYGGGPGMVLKPEPMVGAIEQCRLDNPEAPVAMMTPQGAPLTTEVVHDLARLPGLVLVCGRYEGFDERIRGYVDMEISVGDYVLSGGEPAALVVIDAVARMRDGVLGNSESVREESFADGFLEYPQYTRPLSFRGEEVPEVLRSGDHGRVERWRRAKSLERTRQRRPELFARNVSSDNYELIRRELPSEHEVVEAENGYQTDD